MLKCNIRYPTGFSLLETVIIIIGTAAFPVISLIQNIQQVSIISIAFFIFYVVILFSLWRYLCRQTPIQFIDLLVSVNGEVAFEPDTRECYVDSSSRASLLVTFITIKDRLDERFKRRFVFWNSKLSDAERRFLSRTINDIHYYRNVP